MVNAGIQCQVEKTCWKKSPGRDPSFNPFDNLVLQEKERKKVRERERDSSYQYGSVFFFLLMME